MENKLRLWLPVMMLLIGCSEDPEPKFCWDCHFNMIVIESGSTTIYGERDETYCGKTQGQINELMDLWGDDSSYTNNVGETVSVTNEVTCIKANQ